MITPAGPSFEVLAQVDPTSETRLRTPDMQAELVIPPHTFLTEGVQVRVRNVDSGELPPPPDAVLLIRGVQLNTIVDGFEANVPFTRPVVLRLPLTADELALTGGRGEDLRVLRYDAGLGMWIERETTFVAEPAPGYLEATLEGFSFFAIGLAQPEPSPMPSPTAQAPSGTATPAPGPAIAPAPIPQDEDSISSTRAIVAIAVLILGGLALMAYRRWGRGLTWPRRNGS